MRAFILLFILTVAIIFLAGSDLLSNLPSWNEPGIYRARIMAITAKSQPNQTTLQEIVAYCENGPETGRQIRLIHHASIADPLSISYSPGARVFVAAREAWGLSQFYIRGPVRDHGLLILLAIFVCGLLLVGGGQGMRSLISLGLICLLIVKVLLPLTARGYNPLAVSMGIAILATVIALFMVSGFNGKTVAAVTGTICGLIATTFLTGLFGSAVHLTGCSDGHAQTLQYTAMSLNFRGLLFAGIIIGALGAIMDMTMSIASAMQEIKRSNPGLGYERLLVQGFKVARDTIGTMTNTLVLAYVGGAFSLLLLFLNYQTPPAAIFNLEEVATELLRMLAGALGLIAAVPVTTAVAAALAREANPLS